ncbi:MAG: glutathione S-transferase family protein [Hyphomicrobiales bacterium]|nr:glutathione S-transferase family protein [Hyphomicrobiales bacterium]MCA1999239.1 glutathione S-transferase family protein [Hyphomicrobiales bacterium]
MIILYGARPMWGLPDPSPFVTKAEILLKLSGQPYEKRMADFGKAPKGKIPYLDDNGTLVPDSTLIRAHLERQYGTDFDAGLTPYEAGALWAAEKMCEDHLYWLMIVERWANPGNFEKGPKQFFKAAPALIRPFIVWMVHRRLKKTLHGQGIGRFTEAERRLLVDRAFRAIAALLEGRAFAGGDAPCGADATLFAFVQGLLCPHFESMCPEIAARYPVLDAYVARMRARFYPES